MVVEDGEKLIVAPTLTACVAEVNPGADAVMFALPNFAPVTCGCVAGVVAP